MEGAGALALINLMIPQMPFRSSNNRQSDDVQLTHVCHWPGCQDAYCMYICVDMYIVLTWNRREYCSMIDDSSGC